MLIVVRWQIKPEFADSWPEHARAFTEATRAEPGNLWFDWSRDVDDPTRYTLVEAFRDGDAPAEHVNSDHFATAMRELPRYLAATPRIINTTADGDDWGEMGEMSVD